MAKSFSIQNTNPQRIFAGSRCAIYMIILLNNCFFQPLISCNLSKQCRPWSHVASDLTVCQCLSPGFTDNPLSTALWCQSDNNRMAINSHYLDFVWHMIWLHWSMIIMWTIALRNFGICIQWLDVNNRSKNCVRGTPIQFLIRDIFYGKVKFASPYIFIWRQCWKIIFWKCIKCWWWSLALWGFKVTMWGFVCFFVVFLANTGGCETIFWSYSPWCKLCETTCLFFIP